MFSMLFFYASEISVGDKRLIYGTIGESDLSITFRHNSRYAVKINDLRGFGLYQSVANEHEIRQQELMQFYSGSGFYEIVAAEQGKSQQDLGQPNFCIGLQEEHYSISDNFFTLTNQKNAVLDLINTFKVNQDLHDLDTSGIEAQVRSWSRPAQVVGSAPIQELRGYVDSRAPTISREEFAKMSEEQKRIDPTTIVPRANVGSFMADIQLNIQNHSKNHSPQSPAGLAKRDAFVQNYSSPSSAPVTSPASSPGIATSVSTGSRAATLEARQAIQANFVAMQQARNDQKKKDDLQERLRDPEKFLRIWLGGHGITLENLLKNPEKFKISEEVQPQRENATSSNTVVQVSSPNIQEHVRSSTPRPQGERSGTPTTLRRNP